MEWFSRNKHWLTAIVFASVAVVLRFLAADQTPHPTGWDGYYYVMQVHSWITYGYLQSPDFSLIYPYLTAIAFLTGDVILAYKIGVALLSGLLIAAVFYSLHKRNVSLTWICLVGSYLIFSPLATYFVLQFPKNVLGLIFLILLISSSRNLVTSSPRHLVLSSIFLVATIMTHRMTGGFALIVIVIFALKNIPWKWIVGGGVALLLISFLPGILHVSDLMRFRTEFSVIPNWPPYSFYEVFPSMTTWFMIDLGIISVLIIIAVLLNIRNLNLAWLAIALISIFPFFVFAPGSAGHRFFLVAPLAFIMSIPFEKLRPGFSAAGVVVFSISAFFSFESYKPHLYDPPNRLYKALVSSLKKTYDPTTYPLVIAHKSLAEMIIFTTDFDALNWLPPKEMPPTHVLRLINGVPYSYFYKYLDDADVKQVRALSRDYFAAPEYVWQRFVTKATKDNDYQLMQDIFNGRNPMDERPYFLNKGKIR